MVPRKQPKRTLQPDAATPEGTPVPLGGTVTALAVQKRSPRRVNVFIDDVYRFSLSVDTAACLSQGSVLTDDQAAALVAEEAITRAVDTAAQFLGVRPRSTAEVTRRLADKDTPPAVIAAAIARLTALGYLDDAQFAAFWVRERLSNRPISPRALRYELRQKGLDSETIDAALADLNAADAADRAVEQSVKRLRGKPLSVVQPQVINQLARRGFSYRQVKDAFARLLTELPPTFFAPDEPPTNDENADPPPVQRGGLRRSSLQKAPPPRRKALLGTPRPPSLHATADETPRPTVDDDAFSDAAFGDED